jgi:PIN domain nuclease of toxin-antitoxin system
VKRLLLDTHVLLWWLGDNKALAQAARDAIGSPDNIVYVSAASIWEIAIKKSLGKLRAPDDFESMVEAEGFEALPISLFHAEQAGALPPLHRDPFDRMLVAQAQAEGLIVISQDRRLAQYGVRVVDPRK